MNGARGPCAPFTWHRLFDRLLGWYNSPRLGTDPDRRTTQEEREMISAPARMAAIFVDRACTEYWIVRDPEGNFCIVQPVENAWECRQPFQPTEETELLSAAQIRSSSFDG